MTDQTEREQAAEIERLRWDMKLLLDIIAHADANAWANGNTGPCGTGDEGTTLTQRAVQRVADRLAERDKGMTDQTYEGSVLKLADLLEKQAAEIKRLRRELEHLHEACRYPKSADEFRGDGLTRAAEIARATEVTLNAADPYGNEQIAAAIEAERDKG